MLSHSSVWAIIHIYIYYIHESSTIFIICFRVEDFRDNLAHYNTLAFCVCSASGIDSLQIVSLPHYFCLPIGLLSGIFIQAVCSYLCFVRTMHDGYLPLIGLHGHTNDTGHGRGTELVGIRTRAMKGHGALKRRR